LVYDKPSCKVAKLNLFLCLTDVLHAVQEERATYIVATFERSQAALINLEEYRQFRAFQPEREAFFDWLDRTAAENATHNLNLSDKEVRTIIVLSSPATRAELAAVLSRPQIQRLAVASLDPLIQGLDRYTWHVPGDLDLTGACRDPKDDKFLACAVEGDAHYLVSSDKDLLDMKFHLTSGNSCPSHRKRPVACSRQSRLPQPMAEATTHQAPH
jgi:putative PIN family toxin of toxin-antitoxin system